MTDPRGTPTLGDRLSAARRRRFTGRTAELALFREALAAAETPFSVLYVHGPGGIGKTALLRQYAEIAAHAGARMIRLDGRDLLPSPDSVEAALARAIGRPEGPASATALADGPRLVLLLDTYEALSPLDDWMREQLFPRLPADALVVLASRQRPGSEWRADAGWREVTRVLALGHLSPAESRSLLADRVPERWHDRVLAFSRGHPLALSLAADFLAQCDADDGAADDGADDGPKELRVHDVVRELTERFAATAPGPRHRRALEVCAHVRWTTEDLLRAALGDAEDVPELFAWLAGLSFVEQGPHGLHPHDLVREVLEDDLRRRAPSSYVALDWQVRRHIVQRILHTHGAEQEQAVSELFYVQRGEPLFARYVCFSDDHSVWPDRLRPGDGTAVVRLVSEAEGPESGAIAAFWLARRPEAFRVYRRTGADTPIAVAAWLLLDGVDEEEVAGDPVLAAAWTHIRRAGPLRPGERLGLTRFLVYPDCYQRPSPVHTLMQARTVFHWVSDGAAWTVVALADPAFWAPHMAHVDHARAAGAEAEVGDRSLALFAHDWRVRPVRDWFNLLAERMVGGRFDPEAGTQTPPPRRVLSEAEFAAAVREALRDLRRPARLARSPLLDADVVRSRNGGAKGDVDTLVDVLGEAVDALREEPDGDKCYRAVDRTYVRPAPTQERAAEVLGIPFSTYRRHLTRGIQRITADLWQREVDGSAPRRAG